MKYRLLLLSLHLSTFMTLMYGYENYISLLYAYEGFAFRPNETKLYLAILMVVLLSAMTPVNAAKPSTTFYHLLLLIILLPMLTLFYAEDLPLVFTLQVIVAYGLLIVLPRFLRIRPLSVRATSHETLQRTLLFIAAVYISSILLMGGAAYFNFNFSRVMDFREDAERNLPGVFGYISPFIGKVAIPIGFVLALLHKRYLNAALFFAASILIFALTAHKAPVFYPVLLMFVYFAGRGDNLALKLNLGILAVLLLSLLDFYLWQTNSSPYLGWTGGLMMKRNFFIPAQINYMYYDFFSTHEFVLFSDSKLSLGLLQYPYPLDTSHLIGREYFNDERRGANTGWLGSGYMQAGFGGLLLYATIISMVFSYIDACGRDPRDRSLITAATVVPVFALLTTSDLPTTFLTHGLIANLILIAYISKYSNSNKKLSHIQSPLAHSPQQT